MTPSCPSRAEWVRHRDGEVTANRAVELTGHAASCPSCRAEVTALDQIVAALRPRTPIGGDFTARVMASLDDAKPRPARRPLWQRPAWLAGGVAFAAAAVLALVLVRPPSSAKPEYVYYSAPLPEMQARGGRPASALDRVEVVLHSLAGTELRPVVNNARVLQTTAYVASYRNPGPPAYALIFALDVEGEVHWLYPAYTDAETDPRSVALESVKPTLFDETVVLESPQRGALMFVVLVSEKPMHVSDIERLPRRDRTLGDLKERFPDASIRDATVIVR